MGNFTSCRSSSIAGCKVVLSDGTVEEFYHPISVAELMLEHPQHFVIELIPSPSTDTATKATPLPADHKLDTNKVYMVLPMARGKNVGLTAEEIHRIPLTTRSALRSRSLPFLPTICMADVATKDRGIIITKEGSDGLVDKVGRVGAVEWTPEIFNERPEFVSRQYSSKGWKPSLGTIEERGLAKKLPHWLF